MSHLKVKKITGGMTFVEVLIGVAILGFLALAVGAFSADVFSLNSVIQNGLTAQQDGRQVVKTMAAELREASQSSTGGYPIELASTSEIIFYSDVNNDGLKEKIRYYLSGLVLLKDVVKPSGNPLVYSGGTTTFTVIHDVRNGTTSIFTYYDKNYTGTSSPLSFPVNLLSIRLIKVSLAIDRDPYRSPVPLFVQTQVMLRNLKDNL